MRKFLCTVTALLLALSCAALADEGAFVSECGYSIALPEGWSCSSSTTEDDGFSGADFFTSDGSGALNVLIGDASGLTTDILTTCGDLYQESVVSSGATDFSVAGMMTYGGTSYYVMNFNLSGASICQAIAISGGRIFTFTFRDVSDGGVLSSVLSSFSA